MKKTALALCAMFLLGNLSYAGEYGEHKDNLSKEERKAKIEEMKQERREFKKKLDELIEKFNKEEGLQKDSVKEEIRALISERTDKDLPKKKEMLEAQRKRIDKLEKEIASIEADKDKYIEEKVEKILNKDKSKSKKKEHKKDKDGKKKDKKRKE